MDSDLRFDTDRYQLFCAELRESPTLTEGSNNCFSFPFRIVAPARALTEENGLYVSFPKGQCLGFAIVNL